VRADLPRGFGAFRGVALPLRQKPLVPILRSRSLKRCFDIAAASCALMIFGLLILIIALVVLAFEGRPIFIRHRRVGEKGVIFPCFKFRTMVLNSDEVLKRYLAINEEAAREWERARKLKHDPRVTSLGRVLRQTSLDELPQLVNILRGEMSVVGPRPIVSDELKKYGSSAQEYLSIRPGLTGLWQCSGRNELSYDERVAMDAHYARTWSLASDLVIIIRTIPATLKQRGVY
jgi:exopolysaccharide production protein ExoY